VRERLASALDSEQAVQLARPCAPGETIGGFVVGLGHRWVLLAQITDGGYFDGHVAVRLRDIATVRPDRSFQSAFSRTQSQWPPMPPPGRDGIDLDTTTGLLRTMLTADELVGIEKDRPAECLWIGLPDEILGKWFYLWEVRPDGTWEDRPLGYRRRRLSTVAIGGRYQRALATIAGDPPPEAYAAPWRSGVPAR
jgi:hypothetical protein